MEKRTTRRVNRHVYAGDYQVTEKSFEHQSDKVSITVPDESYTVKELMRRFTNGLPIAGAAKDPVYNGGDFDSIDMEKVGGMDPVDRTELAQQQAAKNKELKDKIESQQAEAEAKAKAKAGEFTELQKEVRELKKTRVSKVPDGSGPDPDAG